MCCVHVICPGPCGGQQCSSTPSSSSSPFQQWASLVPAASSRTPLFAATPRAIDSELTRAAASVASALRGEAGPSAAAGPSEGFQAPSGRLPANEPGEADEDRALSGLDRALLAAQLAAGGRATPASVNSRAASPTPSTSSILSAASDFIGGGDRSFSMSGVWARRHRQQLEARQRAKARELQ